MTRKDGLDDYMKPCMKETFNNNSARKFTLIIHLREESVCLCVVCCVATVCYTVRELFLIKRESYEKFCEIWKTQQAELVGLDAKRTVNISSCVRSTLIPSNTFTLLNWKPFNSYDYFFQLYLTYKYLFTEIWQIS